jgi:hypothetical protein
MRFLLDDLIQSHLDGNYSNGLVDRYSYGTQPERGQKPLPRQENVDKYAADSPRLLVDGYEDEENELRRLLARQELQLALQQVMTWRLWHEFMGLQNQVMQMWTQFEISFNNNQLQPAAYDWYKNHPITYYIPPNNSPDMMAMWSDSFEKASRLKGLVNDLRRW